MLISSRVKIHINIYIHPLVICYIAIEHDTFIVDLAIKDGYFPCFFFYVYQRVTIVVMTIV